MPATFSAMASESSDDVALLAGLAADGTAVVIVTHDPAVAAAMDRRVVMRDGRIVADGRPSR